MTAALHQALQEDPEAELLVTKRDDFRRVSLAVECFHIASLVLDDIEDMDESRYGEKALHEEHGVGVALNVGDALIGDGYRLLAGCNATADLKCEMLRVAAEGHRTLCQGQGAELCWANHPAPLTPLEVLEIFRQKTAPAFAVALHLGAILANRHANVQEVIENFSRSLGIAYQIRDDLNDLTEGSDPSDLLAMRPTLPLAVAYDRAKGEEREFFARLWRREAEKVDSEEVRSRMVVLGVEDRCRELLEAYKTEAIRSLWELESANAKGLLRRVIGKIFNETEIKGWCNEFEARNAAGRAAGAAASA